MSSDGCPKPPTSPVQVLFDHVGSMKKYETVQVIMKDFFELRLKYYVLRKDWLLGMLGAEGAKLSNQARFILEKIEGTLVIGEGESVRSVTGPHSALMICHLWFVLL